MKLIWTSICILMAVNGISQKLTLYFDFDKANLTTDVSKQLDSFLLARKEAGIKDVIQLHGYCDVKGTEAYNQTLSENRVVAVKQYLLANGMSQSDIDVSIGHGEHDPVNQNRNEEERQWNRRVEISWSKSATVAPQKKDERTLTEKISDTATKVGTSLVLKNMNFYGGTPFLLPESSPIVDELIDVMRRNPSLVIQIQGHICCIPDPGDSQYGPTSTGLSEERAKSIYAELIGHGIEANRVSYKGFGHSMPIYAYPERSEEERVANRRVEIKIVSK